MPEAPAWFRRNLTVPAERFSVTVEGAAIDCRAWGGPGKPGVVLLHGNSAHHGWWSYLAPFLAETHRVVAFSMSGMGDSGRRTSYFIRIFAAEALAAAEEGGANLAGPPVMIGHSAGGMPVLWLGAHRPDLLRAAVIVDSGLPGPEMDGKPPRPSGRTYPDIAEALSRFRLAPPQLCKNLYIADYIAREGLRREADGSFAWKFDQALWGGFELSDSWDDLAAVQVPFVIVRGGLSELTGGAMGARIRRTAPAGTAFVEIPEAHHHVMIDQPLALVAALRSLLEVWQ